MEKELGQERYGNIELNRIIDVVALSFEDFFPTWYLSHGLIVNLTDLSPRQLCADP